MRRPRQVLYIVITTIILAGVNLYISRDAKISKPQSDDVDAISTESVRKLKSVSGFTELHHPEHCSSCRNSSDFEGIKHHHTPVKKLLIFTNKRSGSSYVGELFNRNKDVFYMFEPLLPFTRKCNLLVNMRLATLENCLSCELDRLENNYVNAFTVTKHDPKDCLDCGICFYNRHHSIHRNYYIYAKMNKVGVHITSIRCPYHLNMNVVSKICKNSTFSVYKILRVCLLEQLETIYPNLFEDDPDLFHRLGIIHLIRDPRAIISSRLLLETDEARRQNLASLAKEICDKMEKNILYSDETWTDGASKLKQTEGVRYMRIRFEDVVSVSQQTTAKAIYRYFGHTLPMEVKVWIHEASNPKVNKGPEDQFSTKRESLKVLHGWRSNLNIEQVITIQDNCENMLQLMGYKTVKTSEELLDLSRTLW